MKSDYSNSMNEINLLRLKDVSRMTGLSRSSIYRLISEHQFPKPVKLKVAKITTWRSDQIRQWIDNQIFSED